MPDLPSSDPDSDRRMFYYVLSSPDLQADQWKIYPCEVTPFSTIEVRLCRLPRVGPSFVLVASREF